MTRTTTLLFACLLAAPLLAASGGPDGYGYTWKDSAEPDGPLYNWIDITSTGTLLTGLGDDNRVGPFVMETNMPFYWYNRKLIWIGSNGYVSFNAEGNLASPFPAIPTAGGVNDHIAVMASDLNFAGAGNTGQCYLYDDSVVTIISWVNVPFWSPTAPTYTGSNSFQLILDKLDGLITFQYQTQTGLTQNNDIVIGIESVAGSIGLQHSNDVYPAGNYAIRFDPPVSSTLEVLDGIVGWSTEPGSVGLFRSRNGATMPLWANAANIGNTTLTGFTVQGQVLNGAGAIIATDQRTIGSVLPGQDTSFTYTPVFNPATAGIYRYRNTVSGIAGELVTTNNVRVQEIVVVDTTAATHDLNFHGATDDGIGLGWNGGNGGVGMRIQPPYYPAFATATTVRIVSNTGGAGYTMKVYDDDGPGGMPGTLLDSVLVPAAQAVAGSQVIPLSAPLTITSGAVYVQWYMLGANINIAQDITPPFSLQTYEVLDGTWAEYRDRESVDFFLGLRLAQVPVLDLGCTGFFGLTAGQDIGSQTAVRVWVNNLGNQPVSNYAVNYRFGTGPVTSQNVSGTPLLPGAQTLITFTSYFVPTADANAELCAWTTLVDDASANNDTACVQLQTWVGMAERAPASFQVFPNPTSGPVQLTGLPDGRWHMQLFDAAGRAVFTTSITTAGGNTAMDLSHLEEGSYRLLLDGPDGRWQRALVIQR